MSSVTLRGVTKRYGSAVALNDVSLNIGHGLLVSLLGPSGCGKTTALRLVAGFVEPTAGEIAIGDRVVSSRNRMLPPERRNVSMVFQSYALWPHMTVWQNVAFRLRHAARNFGRVAGDTLNPTGRPRLTTPIGAGWAAVRGAAVDAARGADVVPGRRPRRRTTPPTSASIACPSFTTWRNSAAISSRCRRQASSRACTRAKARPISSAD